MSVGEGVVLVLFEEVEDRGTEKWRDEADVTLEVKLLLYPDAFAAEGIHQLVKRDRRE